MSKKNLITLGYYKGEMDFSVSTVVGTLTLKELKELREIIVVAIWCAEDMWKRNNEPKASQDNVNLTTNREN